MNSMVRWNHKDRVLLLDVLTLFMFMKKKLSSDLTPLYKSLWIFFVMGLGIMLFITAMPSSGTAAHFFFWTMGAFLFWGLYRNFGTVAIDDHFIYVTRNRYMAIIPVSEIKSVH